MPTSEVSLVLVLWALGLDVSWLSALVAGALSRGLGWAVSAQVTGLAAVVALLSLGAVAGHVADATARVAGLLATTVSTGTAAVATTTVAGILVTTGLWAVAGNVSDLGALVALLAGSTAESASGTHTLSGWVGAVTADVSGLAALVAGLVLWSLWALTAHVSLTTTVVALGWATGWAITGLVSLVTTVVASTLLLGGFSVVHFERIID